ncbi:DUF4097 family beta strand repeat-containing protein [Tengunoibacter tsumagoiensis]|uniref:DUF4097 domain-containing protein n=1 Tax=Tengunoibacter tsumagoiensis TaxID=2014871 RepID=A0A402AAF5_9CHLR|nr:DUF4097 family beta strand repeat-containing protein [Tengunoibacter tsumagoiensis]GCE16162.1 hypothetical protein KTT_60210 [Tengunoibacter tsumagoiensis]
MQTLVQNQTFPVHSHPTILVKNTAGFIHVSVGSNEYVEVKATTLVRNDAIPEIVMQNNDNRVSIEVRYPSFSPTKHPSTIDFEILVPRLANLQLYNTAGTTLIHEVTGEITAHATAGTIEATGITLQGQASIEANAGSIHFTGSFNPDAHYTFKTNAGSIDVTLIDTTVLKVEAKTNVGNIYNDFPEIQLQHKMMSSQGRGTIGVGAPAYLELVSNVGTISIHRAAVS